jgi:hypothetical protein
MAMARRTNRQCFADGLYLPTGIEFANGGVYVGQSPTCFLHTDDDDVADVRELALTIWNRGQPPFN